MKNLSIVAKKTISAKANDKTSWISLYYSVGEKAVYTKPGDNRDFVTYLINPNSAADVEKTVNKWLSM